MFSSPPGSELQTAKKKKSESSRLLFPDPEERKPPEQFIFSPLAVFLFFTFSPVSTTLEPDSAGALFLCLCCVMYAQVTGVRVQDQAGFALSRSDLQPSAHETSSEI